MNLSAAEQAERSGGMIMHALYVQPGEEPEEKILLGTESEMEELVHGRIASVGIDEGVCAIYNAFADALNMPRNREVLGRTFYGPIIVVAFDDFGNLSSIDEQNLPYYKELLAL